MPPGVVVNFIVEGSVIAYQCGEGLVSEEAESLQAQCGADGNWSPDPTTLTCRNVIITENTNTESTSCPESTTLCTYAL